MDANTAATLPFTAWEQAVFVALFLVFVVGVLAWMSRETRATRAFQTQEAAARETAQTKRDDQWREFLAQQRHESTVSYEAVKESLDALVAATKALAEEVSHSRLDFEVHDKKEWAKLDEMSRALGRDKE